MLTAKEQEIVLNNLWVVNAILKKLKLQTDDDLRQSAILYMCKCIKRFDETKNTKIKTYLYKSIYLYIKRTHAKEIKKQNEIKSVDISSIYTAEKSLLETQKTFNESEYMVEQIKAVCTPFERLVIDYKLQGYTCAEISKATNKTKDHINFKMKTIKQKAKSLIKNNLGEYQNDINSYI